MPAYLPAYAPIMWDSSSSSNPLAICLAAEQLRASARWQPRAAARACGPGHSLLRLLRAAQVMCKGSDSQLTDVFFRGAKLSGEATDAFKNCSRLVSLILQVCWCSEAVRWQRDELCFLGARAWWPEQPEPAVATGPASCRPICAGCQHDGPAAGLIATNPAASQDNQLEGNIPVSKSWRSLHILRLANNRLTVSGGGKQCCGQRACRCRQLPNPCGKIAQRKA